MPSPLLCLARPLLHFHSFGLELVLENPELARFLLLQHFDPFGCRQGVVELLLQSRECFVRDVLFVLGCLGLDSVLLG